MMTRSAALLQQYFGYTSFRPGQAEAIYAILSHHDVLAIMPTGSGKSVCYQIAAMQLPGMTIVISPLISLMQDQVDSLKQIGIPAAYLNSSMSLEEMDRTVQHVLSKDIRILYVAPERLTTHQFLQMVQQITISLVAVDEAHCVSQWGQDFRPGYMDIAPFVHQLEERPVCAAFTATATPQVELDITQFLDLQTPQVVKTGFDRKNLFFENRIVKNKDKDAELVQILRENPQKSGIVYCSTRKNVEHVYSFLGTQNFSVTRYHAGLSAKERAANQDAFLYDQRLVMVATCAFGMGIDKSNVSFVVHYNMPKDLESYYQEAGRAGRDGTPAKCILLYSDYDVSVNRRLLQYAVNDAGVDEETRASLLEKSQARLRTMTSYAKSTDCLRHRLLLYFGEASPLVCNNCSNCLSERETEDVTIPAQKVLSCVYRGRKKGLHMSRSQTAATLCGSKARAVLDMHLDQLSTYGILSDWSQSAVMDLIDELIEQGDLDTVPFQTREYNYPELVLTSSSVQVLRGEKKVVRMKLVTQKVYSVSTDRDPALQSTSASVDSELYQRLVDLRKKISFEQHVPAYIVFTNQTLQDMCKRMPCNMKELREVSGVGIYKAQKYGKQFLDVIATYQREVQKNKA